MKPRIAFIVVLLSILAQGQTANTVEPSHYLEPAELVKLLPKKPLILNVGPHTIYSQAHIPGAEYIGMTAQPEGIKALRHAVQKVPKNRQIVLYCGCCPWSRCPNIAPALSELSSMGFTNVRVLHIAQNFGADWVDKGLPVEHGEAGSAAGR